MPRTHAFRLRSTHRLIPAKYLPGEDSVLSRLADDDAHLADLFALDAATNDRLHHETGLLPGIGANELVFGIPHYRVINAAFCHARQEGGRFNGPDRGAWYAGLTLTTAKAEIAFHKGREFAEIAWNEPAEVAYTDYLADFSAEFVDLRGDPDQAACLDPASYAASQTLAAGLLASGGLGIVYPSVRAAGTCLACFRPALVNNVRRQANHVFRWRGMGLAPEFPGSGPA
jgi:RES domain-containing protein